jgi:ParB-like chromosome segregation protein Spo0J
VSVVGWPRQAGLETIPAIFREVTRRENASELALIENIQRADLDPLRRRQKPIASSARNSAYLTRDIRARVGKSRAAITNTLRLLKLPDRVQAALKDGKISEGTRPCLVGPARRANSTYRPEHDRNKGHSPFGKRRAGAPAGKRQTRPEGERTGHSLKSKSWKSACENA